MVKTQKTVQFHDEEYNVVCPFCNAVCEQILQLNSVNQKVKCCSCAKIFDTKVCVVRSKRSKILKDSMGFESREFNIRVYTLDGQEELLNFINYNALDLELRSGDTITLSFDNSNSIRVIGNQTINYHLKVGSGSFQKGVTLFKDLTCGILSLAIFIFIIWLFAC